MIVARAPQHDNAEAVVYTVDEPGTGSPRHVWVMGQRIECCACSTLHYAMSPFCKHVAAVRQHLAVEGRQEG